MGDARMTKKEELFSLVAEAKENKKIGYVAISVKNEDTGGNHVVCNPVDEMIDTKMEIFFEQFDDDLFYEQMNYRVMKFEQFPTLSEVTLWMRGGQHKEEIEI